jgi:ElaB/YqjD/DUF883 family membrane-anchored ribosome-binding protein
MAKNEKKVSQALAERTEDLKVGLAKTSKNLKAGMDASVEKSRKAIQKRPLTAVGVAAGAAVAVGVVAGAVLTQRKKRDDKKET